VTSSLIERLYEQSRDNKESSRRNREAVGDVTKRMNAAASEAKLLDRERQHAEGELASESALSESSQAAGEQEKARLEALKVRMGEIEGEAAKAEEKLAAHTERLESLEKSVHEKKDKLESSLARQKDAENRLTDLRVRLNVLESNISNQKKRAETIETDLDKYAAEIAECDRICADAEETVKGYRDEVARIEEKLAASREKTEALRKASGTQENEARRTQADIASLDSRIAALTKMLEHFDGYNNAVRYVMNESAAGRLEGIRGPLSTLISVEKAYIPAIETSLGGALQNIVTADEPAAKQAIAALKRSGAGRATFYPVTTVRAQERGRDYDGVDRARGFIGWGDDLTASAPEYRTIVKSLLGRLAVFDTLDNASDAARARGWKIRAVTLDGQQINAGGSFTGGAAKRDSGMLSRSAEIDGMKRERAGAEKVLADLRRKIASAAEEIAAIEAENKGEEERARLMNALAGTEEKTYSDADGRRKTLCELVDSMKRDAAGLDESSARSSEEIEKLRQSIEDTAALAERIRLEREEIAAEQGEAELEASEVGKQANEVKIRLAELNRDREAAAQSIRETEERSADQNKALEAHRARAEELKNSIRDLTEQCAELEKDAEALRGEIAELEGKQSALDAAVDEIDTRLSGLRKTEQEQMAKKDLVFAAHSKNEARLGSLKESEQKAHASLWDDYELTWATAVRYAEDNGLHTVEEGERSRYLAQQNELKAKLRALGHVNVDAVDEYNEVKSRYETITTQLSDLRASREDLEKVIRDIENDMKTMFLDAFGRINAHFGEVFRELFGGGRAEVILTDPENVLESGIEINAAPPGKTVKNLNLLSGGEQAFIAIALLFALIKVNPSPFCVFDEIEAALDEVNVSRAARYVKNISKDMQIIMISHRRGTMDIADTLYGVTMQKSGVSKVFTLGAGDDREAYLK